jgi:hypothetical protein
MGAFDDLIPPDSKEQAPTANAVQRMLNGPVRGLSNVVGLPGTMMETAGKALRVAPEGRPDPADDLAALGHFVGPENVRRPLQSLGVIPPENYKAPTAGGRMLDTVNEYVYGAAPAIAAAPARAATELAAATGAGAGGAVARELAPQSPIAELLTSLVTGGGTAGAINAVKRASGWIGDVVSRYTPSGQRQRVATDLKSVAVDPGTAAENLETQPTHETGGFKTTSGTLSNDEGLIGLERGFANEPKYVARVRGNERSISDNTNQTLDETLGASGAQTGKFFDEQRQGMAKAADEQVADAEKNLAAGEQDLAKNQAELEAQGGRQTQSSMTAREAILNAKKTDDAALRQAYDKIDPNSPASFDNAYAAAVAARKEVGETGDVPPIIQRIIAKRKPEAAPAEGAAAADAEIPSQTAKEPPAPKNFAEIQADLRNVNQAIVEAERSGRPNDARLLGKVRDGINADLDQMGANNEALRSANALYRESYAPKYREGATADVLKREGTLGSDTIDAYMKSPEGAQQLQSIVGKDPAAQKAVRDWFVSDMVGTAPAGKISADRLDKWIKDRSDMLAAFPAVRQEVQQMRNRIANGSAKVGQLENDLKSAVEAQKSTGQALKDDPTSYFVGADPVAAVNTAMSGKNAAGDMQQLVAAARKDSSGEALQGLKNATKEWLNRDIRNAGSMTKNDAAVTTYKDFKVSFAKMNDRLTDPATRKALGQVFSPDELSTLDRYRKQLELLDRRNVQGTVGSSTLSLAQSAAKVDNIENVLKAYAGPIKGSAMARIAGFVETHFLGDPAQKMRQLMFDAMMDPQLARTLLLTPTEKNAPQIQKTLSTWLASSSAFGSNVENSEGGKSQKETPK